MKSKFKKVISTCLAVVMLLGTAVIAPITASAAQTQAVSTGEISGDFEYYDYGDGTASITDYTGSATELTIPSELDGKKVTSIGYDAFEGCTSLASITIPNSVMEIDCYAFSGCSSLASITIPDSVISIGDEAFYGCTSLANIYVDSKNDCYTEIDGVLFDKEVKTLVCCPAGKNSSSYSIPDSVTSIGDYAFRGCTSLTSITIPNSVTSIGYYAFSDCTSLASITIPDSVTSIGYYAFEYCTSLASITIPDSVTEIGGGAFENTEWYNNQPDGVLYAGKVLYTYKGEMPQNTTITVKDGTKSINNAFFYCTSLESVTIPDSVTSIGNEAFYGCTSLTNIYVDSKNESYTEIDGVLFDKEVKTLVCYPAGKNSSSYSIPDSVTSIGDDAFFGCENLTSVTIPDSVTEIGYYAFESCTSLASITIPDSVTEIGYAAFRDCTSLTSITIPASVKYIDDNAFGYYYDDEYNEVKIDGFTITGYLGSAAETYANDNGFEFISLGDLPVEFCLEYELTDNGEIEITGYTGSATELTIPSELDGKKVTSIGYGAFWGCTSLESITIPDSVTSIGYNAFFDCTSLTSIIIPDSVTNINSGALENTAWYDNQPDGVVYVGKVLYTYKGEMPQNTTITVKDGTKSISDSAFSYCTSLASITIPDSVTSIGGGAFSGCTSLESVTIPDSVTEIGYSAFCGCINLTDVDIPSSVTEIVYNTFLNCTSLLEVEIPSTVKSIDDFALGFKVSEEADDFGRFATLKIDGFTIKGYEDTAAEDYATENGFKFINLNDLPTEPNPTEPNPTEPSGEQQSGDVSGDGKINIKDATIIQKSAASLVTLTDEQKKAADVNKDGKVNVKDATAIQKYTAGIDTGLDIGK